MISFSSMNLMVSVCKWFVLLMWLLKCQWRSEKNVPPFSELYFNRKKCGRKVSYQDQRFFCELCLQKTFYGILPVNNDNSNDKPMTCDNLCMDRSGKIG